MAKTFNIVHAVTGARPVAHQPTTILARVRVFYPRECRAYPDNVGCNCCSFCTRSGVTAVLERKHTCDECFSPPVQGSTVYRRWRKFSEWRDGTKQAPPGTGAPSTFRILVFHEILCNSKHHRPNQRVFSSQDKQGDRRQSQSSYAPQLTENTVERRNQAQAHEQRVWTRRSAAVMVRVHYKTASPIIHTRS